MNHASKPSDPAIPRRSAEHPVFPHFRLSRSPGLTGPESGPTAVSAACRQNQIAGSVPSDLPVSSEAVRVKRRATQAHFRRNLWFEDGFWWYRPAEVGAQIEISSVLKKCSYRMEPIARTLGIGERTFHRIVKNSLGIPPGAWLRSERAVSARHRLREGCPVKQLASELGFRNQGDFSMEFKRWHGISPTKFREHTTTRPFHS